MKQVLIIKGHIVHTTSPAIFEVHENSFLIVVDGLVQGIYSRLPENYSGYPVEDYGDKLIIPGFVDLHLHGAQFLQCGMGMTKKLLQWLNDYTFKLEKKFQNPVFAKEAYESFARSLVAHGTLRACIFGTSSTNGTEELFQALKRVGVGAYVGKVNMDCNAPDYLLETAKRSLETTRAIIEKYKDEPLVKPIITPRFAPTCSRELLEGLGQLAKEYDMPVQSHLNECEDEITWVRELFPEAKSYSDVYDNYGLFGTVPTLMAHCVHMEPEEEELAKRNGVFLVHCPDSNINVRSGIMPVKRYLDQGFQMGLGSDIAGGHKVGMNEAVVRTIQLSKLRSLETHEEPLTASEAFYLGTRGGGKFFGNTGSFEKGFSFDALVLEDAPLIASNYSIIDRLEKYLYTGDDRNICARYVQGKKIELI